MEISSDFKKPETFNESLSFDWTVTHENGISELYHLTFGAWEKSEKFEAKIADKKRDLNWNIKCGLNYSVETYIKAVNWSSEACS
jgi:hypothetical protein